MPHPARFQRLASVARKEFIHILPPMTLFFTLFIPICEMFMLGYAIDTNVRNVRTVVYDQARTQESRALLRKFDNSGDIKISQYVFTDEALYSTIVAGKARVGIKIPEDYSRRLFAGETAQVLVLVDGSESSVAAEAVNVGNAIALQESLKLALAGKALPVESHPQVLFNPDTRSANFFIPGLLVVMCQMMAVMLSATSIVREKENGTLEQLFMTPVRPGELILGKLLPYLVLDFVEFCSIAFLMRTVFGVPIHGHFLTLLGVALPFVLAMLGLGLWVSTREHARRGHAGFHGHGHPINLPFRLRVPSGLDAGRFLVSCPAHTHDLDDRCGARSHPARRGLARAALTRCRVVGHGGRDVLAQHAQIPQEALSSSFADFEGLAE